MGEFMTNRPNAEDPISHPPNKKLSVMRRYLESGIDFEWPEGVGKRHGNHCTLHNGPIPLIWKKRISDKKASIDIYISGDEYAFKEPFAVKTIREKTQLKSKTRARNEVESMRDLRYPHIAALLGTYTYQDRLSILIFPAAPCDLHMFLKKISKEMIDVGRGRNLLQDLVNQHTRTDTPESRSSTSSFRDGAGSPRLSSPSLNNPHVSTENEKWPLKLALRDKLESLRGYFVCLSQALNYIHESDVRHKDIKPENILIDASGSVVLTDFGISRRFPKKAPHVTNDQWDFTRKYASPEIMRGKKAPRDDPSDVFSLGCVFLEMASLILGRDLERFRSYYASPKNESGLEDAYYCNLDRVYAWIEDLRRSQDHEPRSAPDLAGERIEGQDFCQDQSSGMIEGLDAIRRMLEVEPSERPASKGLWRNFQHVSSQLCRDCDPRLPDEIWTPNPRQKLAAESGTSRRRSMQLIPEEVSDNPSTETRDGQPEDANLLSANYRPDRHPSSERRASSPHIGWRQQPPTTYKNPVPRHMSPPGVASSDESDSGGVPLPTQAASLRDRRASSPHTGQRHSSPSMLLNPATAHPPQQIVASPEPFTSVEMSLPAEGSTQIRRTTSASDDRKAAKKNTSAGSRSMSPSRRRPFPESRLRSRGALWFCCQCTNIASPKRDTATSPPPASQPEHAPVAPNAVGSLQSLVVKGSNSKLDDTNCKEKPDANRHKNHQKDEHLLPTTQIIIYDLADKIAYVTAYAHLKGKIYGEDYISQSLPRSGQYIEIVLEEKSSPIAMVDLGTLGAWNRIRRWKGDFPTLYVLNFSVQPLG
ncbi:MAG: hypothetical protein Q9181_006449 [Wetmoreana brouardii]